VVTLVLAFLVFGELLGALQLAGGALVLGAVFVLNARADGRSRAREEAIGSAPA
jgi:drug/metabolite transporter (DMT)-like permease